MLFACIEGHTVHVQLPSPKLLFFAFATAYLWPGRSKWDTVNGKNHLYDVDNAGKDGMRVQLHQDGQEDVRKDLFHLAWFSHVLSLECLPNNWNVFSVGKGPGTGRVDMWSGWPPRPGRFQLQTLWIGGILTSNLISERQALKKSILYQFCGMGVNNFGMGINNFQKGRSMSRVFHRKYLSSSGPGPRSGKVRSKKSKD